MTSPIKPRFTPHTTPDLRSQVLALDTAGAALYASYNNLVNTFPDSVVMALNLAVRQAGHALANASRALDAAVALEKEQQQALIKAIPRLVQSQAQARPPVPAALLHPAVLDLGTIENVRAWFESYDETIEVILRKPEPFATGFGPEQIVRLSHRGVVLAPTVHHAKESVVPYENLNLGTVAWAYAILEAEND